MNQTLPNTTQLTSRFESALVYATQLHSTQIRKGSGVPYISHLLSVAALVLEDGGDEDQAIAALLHDAIEDRGGDKTRQEIKAKFGERVVNIVNGCTDAEVTPKPPWKQRKQQYIEKMSNASPEVRRVSMADKLHNLRSILADYHRGERNIWDKFTGGREGSLWYYRSLIEVNRQTGNSYLTEECDRLIQQLERII
jgi:(p)ppGpp synthase/HD superfamily hydrolase